MAKRYGGNVIRLPPVDVPDLGLLARIDGLLRPYWNTNTPLNAFNYKAVDSRGEVTEETPDALRAELDAEGRNPHTVSVRLQVWLPEHQEAQAATLTMAEEYTLANAWGPDEPFVDHVLARLRHLIGEVAEAAAERRAVEEAAARPPAAPTPEHVNVAVPARESGGWFHDVSTQAVGGALAVGIVALAVLLWAFVFH